MRNISWTNDESSEAEQTLLAALETHLSPITAKAVVRFAASTLRLAVDRLGEAAPIELLAQLERAVRLYAPEVGKHDLGSLAAAVNVLTKGKSPKRLTAKDVLAARGRGGQDTASPSQPFSLLAPVAVPINEELDIVRARHAGRKLCERIGFSKPQEIKTATIISELARNIVLYVGSGEIILREWQEGRLRGVEILAKDKGPGIPNLDTILSGNYHSKTGLGLGMLGTKRVAHSFHVRTGRDGTEVTARMVLR